LVRRTIGNERRGKAMHLQITRTQELETDRRGNVRGVNFRLQFQLQLNDEEGALIRDNALDSHLLFESPSKFVQAREIIGGTAEWTVPSLEIALSIQQSMIENCRSFDGLVRSAANFEGNQVIDLASA
jgi:hypothetical protein